jgi:hypothetical protein
MTRFSLRSDGRLWHSVRMYRFCKPSFGWKKELSEPRSGGALSLLARPQRTLFVLGSVFLLATTQACFLAQKRSALQRGAVRIVAPSAVAEPYFGTAPGGRFAVFADGIIDLPNARVAWRPAEPVYLAFASRPHTLLRAVPSASASGLASEDTAADKPQRIELWNALNGRVESTFVGTPLAHSDLDGLMPLQDQQTLVIVDALTARELVRIPMADEALSTVLRDDKLLVLSRKRAPAPRALAQEPLTLQTFQWPAGVQAANHTLKMDWRGHQPKPATEHRSPPFLHRDQQGNVGVGRLFRSNAGKASEKTELYRVAIATNGQMQPASWTITPFAWPAGGRVASLADTGARPIPEYPPPDNVRDVLGRLPRAVVGSLADVRGARVLTHGEGYLCVWSLRAARREACLRVKHVAGGLEEAGIWLQQENGRFGTWSLAHGLQWQENEGAADGPSRASARTSLDCQLSGRGEPRTATITLSDAEGPRFFLYDLGPDAWLIALPDGHYVGSPDAEKKLAFYDDKGALLTSEAVTAAMDAQRVGKALSAAIDCPR